MAKKKRNIGLFFGSFNPIHVGHLALSNYIVENTIIEEIWFVVSPQNPFKQSNDLLEAKQRIKLLELSIKKYDKFKVKDIELGLPTPSYSYHTLRELRKINPEVHFTIIMGSDNLENLSKWKNVDEILNQNSVLVYPRTNYPLNKNTLSKSIDTIEAPVFNIDSTTIRKGLKEGKNYCFLIPNKAYKYIVRNHLYK